MDEWYGLTIDDIRKFEEETKNLLNERLAEAKATEASVPATPAEQPKDAQQPEKEQPSKAKGWLNGWW